MSGVERFAMCCKGRDSEVLNPFTLFARRCSMQLRIRAPVLAMLSQAEVVNS